MAETDPKIQSRLIRDLEPAVAIEIERHIRTTRDWYPHEYVPWSEGRTYGVSSGTTLNTAQTFGFNTTIGSTDPINQFFNFNIDTTPVITIFDTAADNTLDLSGYTSSDTVNLNPGTFSSVDGLTNNIGIAYGTAVDKVIGSSGTNKFYVNADADTINGGSSGTSTVVFSGNLSAYTLARSGGTVTVTKTSNSVTDTITNVATLQFADQSVPTSGITCYLRGTRVMTTTGEVAVEDLRTGDVMVTRFGPLRPVKWIGRQSFNGRFLGQEKAPVCFRAGSLAPNVPCRDLRVSPEHSMVIDSKLVMAKLLVNGVTITQEATTDQIDYFHIDLGVHDCLIADGAWSESYAEQDNRASFHNAAEFSALFPNHQATFQEFCLPPIHPAGPGLVPILAKLADRYPADSFTDDPDLHLMADGTRIDPSLVGGLSWHFEVPAGVRDLRLVSRACSPVTAGLSDDRRRLGFCVMGITVSTPDETRTIHASHRQFGAGVHELEERDGQCCRWTDGDCRLPDALLAGIDEPVTLAVSGHAFAKFLTAPPARDGAAVAPAPALIETNCGATVARMGVFGSTRSTQTALIATSAC